MHEIASLLNDIISVIFLLSIGLFILSPVALCLILAIDLLIISILAILGVFFMVLMTITTPVIATVLTVSVIAGALIAFFVIRNAK